LKKAFECSLTGDRWQIVLARSYLVQFLVDLMQNQQVCDNAVSPQIWRAVREIKNSDPTDISIQRLALLLNLSVPRFKSRFKHETGIPPGEYILKNKIIRAQKLLGEGRLSVTDVAFRLGFSASSHFSRAFRDITGQSPTEYIRKNAARNYKEML
jgi:transcriptional regulator GlxA family with amidase domain